jgi:hypothetical protein
MPVVHIHFLLHSRSACLANTIPIWLGKPYNIVDTCVYVPITLMQPSLEISEHLGKPDTGLMAQHEIQSHHQQLLALQWLARKGLKHLMGLQT